jgi:hypothetical protein
MPSADIFESGFSGYAKFDPTGRTYQLLSHCKLAWHSEKRLARAKNPSKSLIAGARKRQRQKWKV